MFNDAQQKLPNLAIALFECKGARRATKSTRPHCFELLLKNGFMQLAAPDEYVASEWLQCLVQAASGVSLTVKVFVKRLIVSLATFFSFFSYLKCKKGIKHWDALWS